MARRPEKRAVRRSLVDQPKWRRVMVALRGRAIPVSSLTDVSSGTLTRARYGLRALPSAMGEPRLSFATLRRLYYAQARSPVRRRKSSVSASHIASTVPIVPCTNSEPIQSCCTASHPACRRHHLRTDQLLPTRPHRRQIASELIQVPRNGRYDRSRIGYASSRA